MREYFYLERTTEGDGKESELKDPVPMKSLVVLFSYHHNNTGKIASVFAKVLDAQI